MDSYIKNKFFIYEYYKHQEQKMEIREEKN
jgi:hypothetical protein